MALTDMRTDLLRRFATATMAGALVLSPMAHTNTAQAQDVKAVPVAAAGQQTAAAATEVPGWAEMRDARDYGLTGNVGILIYRGGDTKATGEQIAKFLENQFAAEGVPAKAFYGPRGDEGPTAITYFLDKDGWGPYNGTQARENVDTVAAHYRVSRYVDGLAAARPATEYNN